MTPLKRGWLEESTVEVRNAAELSCLAIPLTHRRVETTEKERREHVHEEVALRQPVEEKAAFAVQPSLLLHEREKEKPRQDQKSLRVACLARFVR